MEIKKILAVCIILLFFCVAVAPSINQSVVKAATDDDLVEVTTQACGIEGYGDTTVKLTREQYHELEQYLSEFRTRLNQTATRQEAASLFRQAVAELDRYGVLPNGMSAQKAEKLITGEYLNNNINNGFDLFAKNNLLSRESNYLCLTVGKIYQYYGVSPLNLASLPFVSLAFLLLMVLLNANISQNPLFRFLIFFGVIVPSYLIAILLNVINIMKPVSMMAFVIFSKSMNLSTWGTSGLLTFDDCFHGVLQGYIGFKITFIVPDSYPLGYGSFLLGFSLAAHKGI